VAVKLDRRILLLAGALVAAVVVVVILIVVSGGSKSTSAPTGPTTTGGPVTTSGSDSTVRALFAGIPQTGDTLGRAGAPASLLVFEDPQCPYCAEWNLNTLPTVVAQFVRTGKLKLVYRGIEILGPKSVPGLRALYAAGRQNRLWQLDEELYRRQGKEQSGWITPVLLRSAATSVGLDPDAMAGAAASAAVTAAMNNALAEAKQYQVGGTPTFVLTRPPALPQQLQVPSLEPGGFVPVLSAALG
jgi:protein-disulfide isomerase